MDTFELNERKSDAARELTDVEFTESLLHIYHTVRFCARIVLINLPIHEQMKNEMRKFI